MRRVGADGFGVGTSFGEVLVEMPSHAADTVGTTQAMVSVQVNPGHCPLPGGTGLCGFSDMCDVEIADPVAGVDDYVAMRLPAPCVLSGGNSDYSVTGQVTIQTLEIGTTAKYITSPVSACP